VRYFRRKLDDKNRLTIPAELHDEFKGGKIIITRGFKDYLHLYSEKVWDAQFQTATRGRGGEAMPILFDEQLADMSDRLIEGMSETSMDKKQGRVTIDSELLKYAGFDKEREVVATKLAGDYWRLKTPRN
jgi:DNA-binding transcriptional regulator/RsmH inhibitor MraZ